MASREGWILHIEGEALNPENDVLTLARYQPQRIVLEIAAPGIRSAGEDQMGRARQLIEAALSDLQEALNSPSGIAGLR